MPELFPPPLGTVIAGRFELLAPLRGDAAVLTFLVKDSQTGKRRALTLFDPALATAAVWAEYHRLWAAAGEAKISGLTLPPQVPATPPEPPHVVDDPPAHRGLDRLRTQEGRITWQRALTLGERIAAVLHEAYVKTGAAHRALTPSRCTVGEGDAVEVLDFGFAEIELAGEQPEEVEYRAPERANHKGDSRSDVFSLAAIVYELISGTCPSHAPPLLSSIAYVPPAVERLLDKALAADPEQRPADLATMRAALREALGLPALSANQPETPSSSITPETSTKTSAPGQREASSNPPPNPRSPAKQEVATNPAPWSPAKQETPTNPPPSTWSPAKQETPTNPPPSSWSPIKQEAATNPPSWSPAKQSTPIQPPAAVLRPLAGRPMQSPRAALSRRDPSETPPVERTERLPAQSPHQDTTLILSNTEDAPTDRVPQFGARPDRQADPAGDRTAVFQKRRPSPQATLPDESTEKLPTSGSSPDPSSLPDRTEILPTLRAPETSPLPDRTEMLANPRLAASPRPQPPTRSDEERTTIMVRKPIAPGPISQGPASSLDPTIGAIRVHKPNRPQPAQAAPTHLPAPAESPKSPAPINATLRRGLLKINLVLVVLLALGLVVWALT